MLEKKPSLDLKPLLKNLKYVILAEEEKKSVITYAALPEEEEKTLITVLKQL